MIRIAVCDDQKKHLQEMNKALEDYLSRHSSFAADISLFSDTASFRSALHSSGGWDIVILDICLPLGELGTDLAREIRERHDRTEIIFVSVSRDFAVDAFSLNAVHYVVKPFSQEDFDAAMDRAFSHFSGGEEKRLVLNLENGEIRKAAVDDIIYIESVGYRRIVHCPGISYEETRTPLSRMLSDLEAMSPGQFIMPYRGYIINLDAVRTITVDGILMQNGDHILIKRGDFRKLRDRFLSWSFRENRT